MVNYWLLLGSPDKWFCESCNENAKVNETLRNLDEQSWRVRSDYFKNAKVGDKCIVKISQDKRSIERRTLDNGEVVDKLDAGIYIIAEIINELYFDENDDCYRIKIKVINNLFKDLHIISDEDSEKILGHDYFTQSSKKIDRDKYEKFLLYIKIESEAIDTELEGEENLESESSDENNQVYPAEVKIQRDMYSVRELKTDFEDKLLILAPDFQREFVWKLKQKSELIESILMGIPLPMIYFFEGDNGIIQVVDGKQRLTSLFEFLDNKYPLSSSLSILKDIRGKKYKELSQSERTKIARYQFVTQTIIPPTPDKIKFDIFERVNRKGTTLNNQEMRNALYQGKATELLERLSKNDYFKQATDNAISPTRMKDRYIILRFIAFYLWKERKLKSKKGDFIDYKSDIDEFLGNTMTFLNNLTDNSLLSEIEKVFEDVMGKSLKIRGKDGFRIPSKERKRPINMALMECLSYFYSKIEVDTLNKKTNIIKDKVEKLFQDKDFIVSITQRVDSSTSVRNRFNKIDILLKEIEK